MLTVVACISGAVAGSLSGLLVRYLARKRQIRKLEKFLTELPPLDDGEDAVNGDPR